ncbi:putative necrosis-inducing factor-domain-containing protein [Phialemonium atrogriseum]|uniref:Necrosis-inducing factor-domain-containing protein n=1 Tax=Phialemonium atrogriseum TaxID=1093897 RepID=A0AAJ0BSB2_9PEZI|nr:putative necrosis-inducing factor-domain-containing protein [Phialemonium atrogriseum]KAK1762199.1 putative necrosis-inducing factor-domain-containing protein [Phialemonium atrogriseum]
MRVINMLLIGAGLVAALPAANQPATTDVIEHHVQHPNGTVVSVFEMRPRISAPPTTTPVNNPRRAVNWFVMSKWDKKYGMCGATTWDPKTGTRSPLISDCVAVAAHVADSATGYYAVRGFGDDAGTFQGLLYSGSCYFGIRPKTAADAGITYAWYIGTQDIQDLIRDSISQFGKKGRVSVEGDMSCKNDESVMDVHWGIYGY